MERLSARSSLGGRFSISFHGFLVVSLVLRLVVLIIGLVN